MFVIPIGSTLFEGVCVNYRHPAPRRGEPRVCSTGLDAFWLDPLDPLQSSETLVLKHPSRSFGTFGRKMGAHFDPNLQKSNEKSMFPGIVDIPSIVDPGSRIQDTHLSDFPNTRIQIVY